MSGSHPGDTVGQRHMEVPRTARYAVLGDEGPSVEEVWFVLHGYQQLARTFIEPFAAVAGPRRFVVAPEGLSRDYVQVLEEREGGGARVGATWMTSEDRETEIRDYVRYLDLLRERIEDELYGAPRRFLVLGFSQGVHTASRWTTMGVSEPPTDLILWGSHLPPDLDLAEAAERWHGVRVLLVRGRSDRFHSEGGVARDASRLEEAGIEHQVLVHDGGHTLGRGVLEEIAGMG